MLSLNFILFFIGFSVALLMGIMIYGTVEDNLQTVNENCDDVNCEVFYGGADCLNCGKDSSSGAMWTVIALIPIAFIFPLFWTMGFFDGFKDMFGGFGGNGSDGGVVSSSLFIEDSDQRQEKGWLTKDDFNGGNPR